MSDKGFGVLLAILAIPLLWALLSHAHDEHGLALLEARREGVQRYEIAARQSLNDLTKGTRFEGRWDVNPDTYDAEKLTVMFFRARTDDHENRKLQKYIGNCGFSGVDGLVICDASLFETLMRRWRFDVKPDMGGRQDWPNNVAVPVVQKSDREQAADLQRIVSWVIGHEIGHVMRGVPGHFGENGLLSDVMGTKLLQEEELAADKFLLDRSKVGTPGRDYTMGFVTELLNEELRLKYCPNPKDVCTAIPAGVGLIYDYASNSALDVDVSKSHPEFLIRLIRLLQLSHLEGGCDTDLTCYQLESIVKAIRANNGAGEIAR